MDVKKVVGYICRDCMFSCHKETCARKSWSEESPLPATEKFGNDTECPLASIEAIKPPARKGFLERRHVLVADTWQVCAKCQYSEVDGDGNISIENAFAKHCMDCSCLQVRENLSEMMAEASIS